MTFWPRPEKPQSLKYSATPLNLTIGGSTPPLLFRVSIIQLVAPLASKRRHISSLNPRFDPSFFAFKNCGGRFPVLPSIIMKIKVLSDIMEANDHLAAVNRERFRKAGVLALNLMSAPGAGKTTLLERTAEALAGELKLGVVEGDIATSRDAERLAPFNIPIVQINTGSECHLDANMVYGAIRDFPVETLDILIIENVGNLVCPAEFIVGEHHKVMILSVTEGDDKPLKYPLMFHESSLMLLNKIDLIPYTDFNKEAARRNALQVSPELKIIDISCRTGEGLDKWFEWLRIERKKASE